MAARELGDGLVVLRPYALADCADLVAAARESSAEVGPWLPWCHAGFSTAEAETWVRRQIENWQDGKEWQFAVRHAASERFVGGCGLNHLNEEHQMANLGYWIRSSETGRGYAASATRLVAEFGLRVIGLERIEIVVAVANRASHRVAEKAGAVREGVLRSRLRLHERSHDAVMYSLAARDLPSLASRSGAPTNERSE